MEEEKASAADQFADFIIRFRKVILGTIVLIIVIGVGISISFIVKERNTSYNAEIRAGLEVLYDEWQQQIAEASEEEATGDEKEKALADSIDEILKNPSAKPQNIQALWYKNLLLQSKEDFSGAREACLELVKIAPKHYLAPLSLLTAASLAEEGSGDILKRIIDEYPEDPAKGVALFRSGILSERNRENEAALTYYRSFLDFITEYKNSVAVSGENEILDGYNAIIQEYESIVRSRIIYLEIQENAGI